MNLRTIQDLKPTARIFSVMTDTGKFSLLYDSSSDEDCSDENSWILFLRQKAIYECYSNLMLVRRRTVKSAPSILYQLFTIMEKFCWAHVGKEKTAVCLLETSMIRPTPVITDLELPIININLVLFGQY